MIVWRVACDEQLRPGPREPAPRSAPHGPWVLAAVRGRVGPRAWREEEREELGASDLFGPPRPKMASGHQGPLWGLCLWDQEAWKDSAPLNLRAKPLGPSELSASPDRCHLWQRRWPPGASSVGVREASQGSAWRVPVGVHPKQPRGGRGKKQAKLVLTRVLGGTYVQGLFCAWSRRNSDETLCILRLWLGLLQSLSGRGSCLVGADTWTMMVQPLVCVTHRSRGQGHQ